jgi:small-conductance mechanosensitive channel
VVGPALFVLIFTVDGALRPGYDPASMFVSELSIGPGGWLQQVNFVVTGVMIGVFATGVARSWRSGRAAKAVPLVLAVLGIGLAASGFFTTDHAVMFTQQSAHGRIHGLLGAVVFLAMPTCCFLVAARSPRDARPRRWRSSTLAVAIGLVVLMVLLKVSEVPTLALFAWKGLVQRIFLVLFLAWLLIFAVRLTRTSQTSDGTAARAAASPRRRPREAGTPPFAP